MLVCFLSATRHLSTLRRCLRVLREQPSRRRERPRAPRGQAHAQREHARACRTTSQRKNRCADAFQKRNCTRAHAVVYVTAEIFKKKPTCHFPSSVYSLPSLGVFTFRIVLNRILHKSSLLAPMESRRTRRPTFTAEERLERRREQDRRRHAERRARQRREQTQEQMWSACGVPKPVPRSTKTTIMTVHVNPIMQAAPSQRRKFCYYEPVVAIVGDHPYFEVFVGMSKVRQRTQPLSCSGHKRNECRAQAALPPMMSGLDSCLRAT